MKVEARFRKSAKGLVTAFLQFLGFSDSTSVLPMFGDASAGTWDTRFRNGVSVPDALCGLYAADWLEPR